MPFFSHEFEGNVSGLLNLSGFSETDSTSPLINASERYVCTTNAIFKVGDFFKEDLAGNSPPPGTYPPPPFFTKLLVHFLN